MSFLFSKNLHDYKSDIDFLQQFNKQEVNIKTYVLDTISLISPTNIILNTVTELFCVSEQHDGDSFPNQSIFK